MSGSAVGFPVRGQPAPTVSDNAVEAELRALGPVEAVVGGELVDLGTPKQRAVFALLLSRVDRPVAVDTLVEELWSGEPPAAAMAVVVDVCVQFAAGVGAAAPTPGPRGGVADPGAGLSAG